MNFLCRICLEYLEANTSNSINVFNNFVNEKSYSEIYEFCIGYSVKLEDDDDPVDICENCGNSLVSFFEFKKKCLKTEKYLKKKKDLKSGILSKNIKEEISDTDDVANSKVNEVVPLNIKEENINEQSQEYEQTMVETEETIPIPTKPHTKKKDYSGHSSLCPVCGNGFTGGSLRHHLKSHDDNKPNLDVFSCDICGKIYKSKSGLNDHMRVTHLKTQNYECPECEEKFDTKYNKKYHIQKFHTDIRFKCQICSYAGVTASLLKKHMRRHTGEARQKKHVCKYESCGKSFLFPIHLREHEAHAHMGKRLFKCDSCDKSYTTSKCLEFHYKTKHIGTKRHACPNCPAAFFKNMELRNHITKVHPEFELPPLGTSLINLVKQ